MMSANPRIAAAFAATILACTQSTPSASGTLGVTGAPGPKGDPGAGAAVAAEPAGSNCSNGGVRVTDGSGHVAYVCHGESPGGAAVPICRGRPGGTCSTTTARACAYDKDCPGGEACGWAQAFARFVDNGNGTVTDRRTCLTWEKKTGVRGSDVFCFTEADCGDPHDVNGRYSWGTGTSPALAGTAATVFLKQLNEVAFAGHTDWRLPTSAGRPDWVDPPCSDALHPSGTCASGNDPELESILVAPNPCGSSPCIDPAFGPTAADPYWSSTSSGVRLVYFVWSVGFADGAVSDGDRAFFAHLRAVRGGPGVP